MKTRVHAACAGALALLLLPSGAIPGAEPGRNGLRGIRAEGVETVSYEGGRPVRRIRVGTLRIEPPRLLGPFRIGFARRLRASDVVVEVRAGGAEAGAPPVDRRDLEAALASVAPPEILERIARADLESVRIVIDDGLQSTVLIEAKECTLAGGTKSLRCERGRLNDGGRLVSFREVELSNDDLALLAEASPLAWPLATSR